MKCWHSNQELILPSITTREGTNPPVSEKWKMSHISYSWILLDQIITAEPLAWLYWSHVDYCTSLSGQIQVLTPPNPGEGLEQQEHPHILMKRQKVKATLIHSMECFFKTRFTLNLWWRNYTSWYPHEMKSQIHTKCWTHVFIKIIFINDKSWDQAKCLTGQWDNGSTSTKAFAAKSHALSSMLRT